MKKDIIIPEVKDVYVAGLNSKNEHGVVEWRIVLINDSNFPLEQVMVNSRGYSDLQSKGGIKTAAMKKLFPVVPAKSAITIEPIMPEVFELFNEYWVTFFQQNQLLDRQFIFGPGTLDEEFQEKLPLLNRLGVLVR